MQLRQRAQRALEREKKKLASTNNPTQNNTMKEQMGNELRAFMECNEQTTQALMEQNERTTQLLLQPIQNMNNNNPRPNQTNGRDVNSNHSKNNRTPLRSTPKITRSWFIPREGPAREGII